MKKSWLDRFSRAARWYLPGAEADDVIADYREMLAGDERSEQELCRDLGRPPTAVRPLVQAKDYLVWLAMFALMAACILLPAASPLPGGPYPIWGMLFYHAPGWGWCLPVLLLGTAPALVWFRPRKGEEKPPLPRAVLAALAAELALTGAVWWILWQLSRYPDSFLWRVNLIPLPFYFVAGPVHSCTMSPSLIFGLLEWGAAAAAVFGTFALVKARTGERRWRAVYVMSLTLTMLALSVLALLCSMDVTAAGDQFINLTGYISITAVGLLGTGAALR